MTSTGNSLKTEQRQRETSGPGSVVIDGVSKSFHKHTAAKRSYTTVKSSLLQRLFSRGTSGANYIHALKELTVHVPPGSALGVIGRNGSGKSTLLKLIAGIYQPDRGAVKVNGRVSALIELGAGFHPDFSGRENIYLGGVMYGLTRREIDRRFDDIVSFAELEDFIDDPVRTYSSGMYMRLGFSLAIHTDPDILLVDEVLAVGDAAFIHRCHDRISDLRRRGKTLIFVTHDLASVVRWCDEAIWLEKGVVRKRGEPQWVIDSYLQDIDVDDRRALAAENEDLLQQAAAESAGAPDSAEAAAPEESPSAAQPEDLKRWGNRDVEITAVRMLSADKSEQWLFRSDDSAVIEADYRILRPVEDLVFGIGILRADGLVVHGTNTAIDRLDTPLPADRAETADAAFQGTFRFAVDRLGLVEGSYFVDVAAHRSDGTPYDYHHLLYKFSVRSPFACQGVSALPHHWEFQPAYQARPVKKGVGAGKVAEGEDHAA